MAGKTNVSDYRFSIFINNDQAKRALIELDKATKGYEDELKRLVTEGKQETQEYKDKKKAYDDHLAQMKKLRQEAGLQALSTKELRQLQAQLNNEYARSIPGSAHRAMLEKELAAVKNRIVELNGSAKNTGLSFGKMADGFNKYFGVITAVAASLTGLVFSFRKVIDTFNEYEKKLDNLSALTGLTGENLQWLSQQAKDLSTGMVEGSVRITQSADAIVDAYTKVGSKRPELLKNKEDLNNVTKEAIILSEAANSELQPAVDALAGVLNQFNAPASDARRIINALAAGSKAGAGEIPYLTEAIEKSGTVAADAGLSYEELIGTIETLAPRISQPEMAGRSLRAVLLRLQEGADDTNPAIVGMATAFENLGRKNLSVTELVKLFGVENITAGKILINNIGELKKYTAAVTDTNVAIEQASINTDNNSSKLAQAQNRVQLLSIDLGEKLAPALTFSTNGFSYLMKAIIGTIAFFNDHRSIVISSLAALTAYTVVVYGAIAVEKAYTAYVWLADIAQKAFNTSMKSTPWGLIASIGAGVVTFLLSYRKNIDAASSSQIKLNDIQNDSKKAIESETAAAKAWFEQLKISNAGSQLRKNLIDKINSTYGTTLKNLSDEKAFLAQIDGSYQRIIDSIKQKILLDTRQKTLTELINQQDKGVEFGKKMIQIKEDKLKLPGVDVAGVRNEIDEAKKYLEDFIKEYDVKIQTVFDQSADKISKLDIGTKNSNTDYPAPSGSPSSDYNENKRKAKELADYLLKIKKDLEDASIQLIKDEHEKELRLNELDYKRKVEGIQGMSADELKLRESYWQQMHDKEDEINKKYSDKAIAEAVKTETEKWKAIIDADEKGSAEWFLDSITLLEKQQALELSNLELTEQQKLDIIAKYEAERRKLEGVFESTTPGQPKGKAIQGGMIQRSGADQLGELQLGQKRDLLAMQRDMELASAQDSADKQAEIWAQFHSAQLAATVDFINAAAQVASQVVSALSGVNQAMSDYENAQLKKDEDSNNKKKANLKARLDSGKITQKQYNDGIAKLDADLDAKKKELSVKQAKRQKALALAQAIINTAQAITSALSAGPIIGIILAALVGILGAVQIAYIASTPIPEAAKGRYGAFLRARQAAKGRYQQVRQAERGRYDVIPQDMPSISYAQNNLTGKYKNLPGQKSYVNTNEEKLVLDLNSGNWKSIPLPAHQAAAGRYSVVGEDDRKQYRDIPYLPKPESGIYSTPTLFAETGREIILNPKHTENLMRFHPDLVSQIMQVPQRASGSYPTPEIETPSREEKKATVGFDAETLKALQEFNKTMSRPLRAELAYDTMVDSMTIVQTIEGDTSR
ncbi:MAG: phage tail tape measure protein [Bacteroidales bacterium]